MRCSPVPPPPPPRHPGARRGGPADVAGRRTRSPVDEGSGRLIKKYSNRKLYDTRSRHYVTLERVGELVRAGESIQAVDRTSGQDLTAITLSPVVLGHERRRHGAVPEKVLQQLVRAPGEALMGAARQSTSAGEDFIK